MGAFYSKNGNCSKKVFSKRKDFATLLDVSVQWISYHIKKGNIVLDGKDISLSVTENRVISEKALRRDKSISQEDINMVIWGNKKPLKPTIADFQSSGGHKKTTPKSGVNARAKILQKYIDPNKVLNLAELPPDLLLELTNIRKLQEQTEKVKLQEIKNKEASGKSVDFESIKQVFDAVMEIIISQQRSGVGRGFGKKIKTMFDSMTSNKVDDVEIVGELEKFHNDFADELLANTIIEIKKVLKDAKLS